MPFECPQDVANDYESLLTNTNIVDYDVIIYAGNNNREIYAHSFVLRTRSQYFRTEFSNGSFNRENGNFIFNLPNITPQLFNMILRFIYCGKIDLDQLLAGSDILNLLIAVNEINIQRLIDYIQEYLIKNKDDYVQQNSIEILEKIHQNNAFIVLQNICIKKICEDPQRLLNSSNFNSLSTSLLALLFNRDDLPLDEIVIWDNLIRWCRAQHSSIPQDPTQWNNDNITNMERTIHRFIPLIRFCHISPENFATRVFPFREILPNNLVNNMIQFNMTKNQQFNNDRRPPRCYIDSVIIDRNHIAVFANWIYRKDNSVDTFLIVLGSEQIVGGYNPLSWHPNASVEWKSTRDSFLFSFANRNNLDSAKVGYSNGDAYSIGRNSDGIHGPIFGRGIDLNLYKNVWYSDKSVSYPKIDIPKKFIADDYEVFQVIKK
ncbi:hypothetical protein GLOIN_2v1557755 [Rhizophagus irregularis DAOM 181602=DAOM 197198]|uniref:BTB domain-containing protein n=1 Tax=Rhizophagus irregularis (strain DAOM 181602 / DAOM 197198 / MUCL 43194) TaxID=747089 RepID=U9UC86_RHIID|nr:hypothetical protein GLOIN_2v1557755 [Rhizophagus irregularis DAOM 181602=DAOM 197198]